MGLFSGPSSREVNRTGGEFLSHVSFPLLMLAFACALVVLPIVLPDINSYNRLPTFIASKASEIANTSLINANSFIISILSAPFVLLAGYFYLVARYFREREWIRQRGGLAPRGITGLSISLIAALILLSSYLFHWNEETMVGSTFSWAYWYPVRPIFVAIICSLLSSGFFLASVYFFESKSIVKGNSDDR